MTTRGWNVLNELLGVKRPRQVPTSPYLVNRNGGVYARRSPDNYLGEVFKHDGQWQAHDIRGTQRGPFPTRLEACKWLEHCEGNR